MEERHFLKQKQKQWTKSGLYPNSISSVKSLRALDGNPDGHLQVVLEIKLRMVISIVIASDRLLISFEPCSRTENINIALPFNFIRYCINDIKEPSRGLNTSGMGDLSLFPCYQGTRCSIHEDFVYCPCNLVKQVFDSDNFCARDLKLHFAEMSFKAISSLPLVSGWF